jgi:hypothetical protein
MDCVEIRWNIKDTDVILVSNECFENSVPLNYTFLDLS